MSNESNELIDVVVASFNDEASALTALEQLKQAHDSKTIRLKDVATLRRDENNELHIREANDASPGQGAIVGGAIGGLLGLLLGPVAIPAAAAGAAIGALTEGLSESEIGRDKLQRLGEGLRAGTAAIVAMTDAESSQAVVKLFNDAGATVVSEGLNVYTLQNVAASNQVVLDDAAKEEPTGDVPTGDERPTTSRTY
jgi:uncharacterized membrane protein